MRIAVILSATLISAVFALAQEPTVPPLVSVDVRVFGAADNAVTGLTRDDFTIYENGQRQDIRNFASTDSPYSILLLIDRSASMESHWAFLEPAISRFLVALRPQDRVAIAGFDDKTELLMDWRNARNGEQVDVALTPNLGLRGVQQAGRMFSLSTQTGGIEQVASYSVRAVQKDFHGALAWASKQVEGVRMRKGVIVFSDANQPDAKMKVVGTEPFRSASRGDSVEDRDFQKILDIIRNSETPFFFLTVDTDINPFRAGDAYLTTPGFGSVGLDDRMQRRSRVEQLADMSGGSVAFPKKPEDLAPLYEQIARELGLSYRVEYAAPRSATDGKYHKIEVRVRGENMHVRQSRAGYYAR